MIQEYVDAYMANKDWLAKQLSQKHPEWYGDLVKLVVQTTAKCKNPLDPDAVTEIVGGHHQGSLLYILQEKGYWSDRFYYVVVSYGSCSGCDTLEEIKSTDWGRKTPDESQVKDYMTLCLHIVQKIKKLEADYV